MDHIACPRFEGLAVKAGRGVGIGTEQAFALAPSLGSGKCRRRAAVTLGTLHTLSDRGKVRLPEACDEEAFREVTHAPIVVAQQKNATRNQSH